MKRVWQNFMEGKAVDCTKSELWSLIIPEEKPPVLDAVDEQVMSYRLSKIENTEDMDVIFDELLAAVDRESYADTKKDALKHGLRRVCESLSAPGSQLFLAELGKVYSLCKTSPRTDMLDPTVFLLESLYQIFQSLSDEESFFEALNKQHLLHHVYQFCIRDYYNVFIDGFLDDKGNANDYLFNLSRMHLEIVCHQKNLQYPKDVDTNLIKEIWPKIQKNLDDYTQKLKLPWLVAVFSDVNRVQQGLLDSVKADRRISDRASMKEQLFLTICQGVMSRQEIPNEDTAIESAKKTFNFTLNKNLRGELIGYKKHVELGQQFPDVRRVCFNMWGEVTALLECALHFHNGVDDVLNLPLHHNQNKQLNISEAQKNIWLGNFLRAYNQHGAHVPVTRELIQQYYNIADHVLDYYHYWKKDVLKLVIHFSDITNFTKWCEGKNLAYITIATLKTAIDLKSKPEFVRELLNKTAGGAADETDSLDHSKNILHYACIQKAPMEVIQTIVECKPGLISNEDKLGKNALDYAIVAASLDIVSFLIAKEKENNRLSAAKPKIAIQAFRTAVELLHSAERHKDDVEIVKKILLELPKGMLTAPYSVKDKTPIFLKVYHLENAKEAILPFLDDQEVNSSLLLLYMLENNWCIEDVLTILDHVKDSHFEEAKDDILSTAISTYDAGEERLTSQVVHSIIAKVSQSDLHKVCCDPNIETFVPQALRKLKDDDARFLLESAKNEIKQNRRLMANIFDILVAEDRFVETLEIWIKMVDKDTFNRHILSRERLEALIEHQIDKRSSDRYNAQEFVNEFFERIDLSEQHESNLLDIQNGVSPIFNRMLNVTSNTTRQSLLLNVDWGLSLAIRANRNQSRVFEDEFIERLINKTSQSMMDKTIESGENLCLSSALCFGVNENILLAMLKRIRNGLLVAMKANMHETHEVLIRELIPTLTEDQLLMRGQPEQSLVEVAIKKGADPAIIQLLIARGKSLALEKNGIREDQHEKLKDLGVLDSTIQDAWEKGFYLWTWGAYLPDAVVGDKRHQNIMEYSDAQDRLQMNFRDSGILHLALNAKVSVGRFIDLYNAFQARLECHKSTGGDTVLVSAIKAGREDIVAFIAEDISDKMVPILDHGKRQPHELAQEKNFDPSIVEALRCKYHSGYYPNSTACFWLHELVHGNILGKELKVDPSVLRRLNVRADSLRPQPASVSHCNQRNHQTPAARNVISVR